MKYLLIYYDKRSSLVMGKYDTYGEALIAMNEARKWHERYHSCNPVRFEISEVSGMTKERKWIQAQIRRAMVERDFDRANMWLRLLRIYDEYQEE